MMAATASSASAASNDQRIQQEFQIKCLNTFGLTPSVRIIQPWVLGNSTTMEKIFWMPYLQVWDDPHRTWVNVVHSDGWHTFWANSAGPSSYNYTYQPQKHLFENQTPGYIYRVVHIIYWSSTGEYGTKPSNYQYASGYCRL
jgi:hypothetical protein